MSRPTLTLASRVQTVVPDILLTTKSSKRLNQITDQDVLVLSRSVFHTLPEILPPKMVSPALNEPVRNTPSLNLPVFSIPYTRSTRESFYSVQHNSEPFNLTFSSTNCSNEDNFTLFPSEHSGYNLSDIESNSTIVSIYIYYDYICIFI